jgi:hypothetical protein
VTLALASLSCGESDAWRKPSDVRAEVAADIATVVRVSWRTDEPSVGYVEYGPELELDFSTPLETTPSRSHSQVLLGLTADTAYSFRVVSWDGREAGASTIQSVRTGALPSQLPAFEQKGSGLEGFVIVPFQGKNAGVAILDADGRVVWYHEEASGLSPFRARLSADMDSVLYNLTEVGPASSEESAIVRVALDGSAVSSTPVPFLAHDFLELPDGKLAALRVDWDENGVRGDSIVELDGDGEITQVWSAFDCFDPALDVGDDSASAWTYANALDYVDSDEPQESAYYVGLRNFGSIAKVRRETGECAWVLGTTAASLELAQGSRPLVHPSGFDVYSNRLLVMDNGLESEASRVVEYEVDLEAGTVSERESYPEPNGAFIGELGSVTRLVNGSWFVNWASAGRIELVEDGAAIWELSAENAALGYHALAETLYTGDSRKP